MNTLVIVLIAAVCLFGAYALYGRWLANKWGIDPTAKTPAVVHEDGRDYVPTDGWTVFAHQFSSIAGAGPVTGAIQAAAFGWLPVLLWVLLGGIFFGAVTDFGALYASVKNDGKSMGMLIEKYIGKTGRKLFLLFCWLFCGIVIAAFADMVAGTFNAYGTDGALVEAAQTNGAAGMVSIMFMVFAVVFGLLQNKFHFTGWKENVISIVFIVLSFVVGADLTYIRRDIIAGTCRKFLNLLLLGCSFCKEFINRSFLLFCSSFLILYCILEVLAFLQHISVILRNLCNVLGIVEKL